MRNLIMFWVLTLFLYGTIHAQNLKNYSIDAPISEGLTLKESNQLQQDIERAMVGLPKIPRLRNTTQLIRPIKQADSFNYHHVFALASHVDHDERKPGYLQDYNCGSFTADGNTNNHSGTDFVLWPFGWHQMDLDQAEVIAAAAGQIVHKIDGRYDRNCLYRFNPSDGNAIFVQHADGTVAWYMNLKSGSLTEKTVGQMVEQGEYLGIVGSSGNSFYPHLHFELRDEEGNVIDPYAGPCNPGESRWANQPDYLESGANYLTTYSQPPNFNNLCDPADQFFQDTYAPGDTLYFLAFIRQQKKGQSPRMGVRFPDGTTLTDRSTTLDRSSARSYFIHSVYLPADAPGGTYSCLLDFDGKTYETSFEVQAEHCSDPKQSNMAAEVYSSTEAQISYAEKNYSAYQWQIRVEGSTSWITLPVEAYRLFIRGLSPQTTYQYRVRYRCGGQWTNWSGIAIFTTPMDTDCPPIELSQTTVDLLSANRANISIQVPGKDAYDWRIRVPGESWTNVHSIPDSIYTFDELSAHTTYLYQVRVKCGNRWSAWSETGSFTTPASVPCPTPDIYTVLATALNSSEVQLTSPDQNKDRYDWRIRLQGSTSWISLPSTGFYSIVLQGLQPGATYEIQHAWRCGSDWSSWSDTLVYNSPAATCPAPALDEIEFEYNSPTLTTIRIHGYTVAGYQIRYREKGTAIWQESAPSAVPMISIPTEPGKEYEFAVRIFCAEEWSPWSETKDFTTPEVNPCLAPELNQTEVSFLTPFDVTLTLKGWTGEPVQMQYRELGAETWLLLEPTGSDSVFQVDNLKENTIYQFRLRAICSNIPGSWSMIGLFTTPELNECPEIHTLDVMVVPVSETTVQLIAPVFPNVKYQWRYRPTESGSWATIPATNASSLILEGLLSNTNYEVQLRVICTTQTTMWSASTLFVTGGQAPCSPPDDQLVAIYNITTDGFSVGLTAEDDKTNYRLRYRKNQSSAWDTLTSTTLPFQLAGLEEGTTYQVAFSWYCTSVWSGWTQNIDVNTLALPDCDPLHPDNITASDITREQITITYPLGNALRYQIRYRMQGSSTWTFMERKSDPEYIIIGLQAGTTYEFQIRQECVSNVWSAWSESNLHSTAMPYFCAAPTATDMIADQLTAFQVTLRYTGPDRDRYQWQVRVTTDTTWTTSDSSTISSRIFGNLKPSTTYAYRLRLDCGEGWSDWSEANSFTTPSELVCEVPSTDAFSVVVIDSETIQLTFLNSHDNLIEWRYRVLGQATWTSTLPVSAIQTEVSGLTPGLTYEFSVRIWCGSSWSNWSPISNTTLPQGGDVCGTPQLNQINVYLLPNVRSVRIFMDVLNAQGYEWRLRQRGVDNWQRSGEETDATWLIDELAGETTYEFQIRALCSDTWTSWSMVGSFNTPIHLYCDNPELDQSIVSGLGQNTATITLVIPDAQAYQWQYREEGNTLWTETDETIDSVATIVGLSPQTTYQYRFRYRCASGFSAWSPIGTFTTLVSEQDDSCTNPSFLLKPEINLGVRLTALADAKLYQWRYRDVSTVTYIETTASMSTERTITGLQPNTTYRFQLRVRCMDTWSDWGVAQQYTTPQAQQDDRCATPEVEQLSAVVMSENEVVLTTSDRTPTQFDWRFRPTEASDWIELTASTNPDKRLSGLTPGQTYEAQLRVLCDGGWSAYSSSLLFTLSENIQEPNFTCTELTPLVKRGDSLFINGPIFENTGNMVAGPQTLFFYLSPDGRPGPQTLFLDSLRTTMVAPGEVVSANMIINLSGINLTEDVYKVGFEIDVFNEVIESDELDNTCFWNTPEVAPLPVIACVIPENLQTVPGLSHLKLSWDKVTEETNIRYDVRYRDIYAPAWTIITDIADNQVALKALDPCTEYEWQVRTICTGEIYSSWSFAQEVSTTGCNTDYCYSYGLGDAAFIYSITMNGSDFSSENDYGYGDHTNQVFRINDVEPLNIIARAKTPVTFDEQSLLYWRFWIDLNQDGDFEDEGEVMAEGTTYGAHLFSPVPNQEIPASQMPYRIRIGVSYDRYPQACAVESSKYIEDYQLYVDLTQSGIKISGKSHSAAPINPPIDRTHDHTIQLHSHHDVGSPFPNPAYDQFRLPIQLTKAQHVHWYIRDVQGSIRLSGAEFMDKGSQQLNIQAQSLHSGFYQLTVRLQDKLFTRPIVFK